MSEKKIDFGSKPKAAWVAKDHIDHAQALIRMAPHWDDYRMEEVWEDPEPEAVRLSIAHSLVALAMQGQPSRVYRDAKTGAEKSVQ